MDVAGDAVLQEPVESHSGAVGVEGSEALEGVADRLGVDHGLVEALAQQGHDGLVGLDPLLLSLLDVRSGRRLDEASLPALLDQVTEPVGGGRFGLVLRLLGTQLGRASAAVLADIEGTRPLDKTVLVPDLDLVEGLGVVADLDAAAGKRGAHLVTTAKQREDRRLVRRPLLAPEEGQPQLLLVGVADLLGVLSPALQRSLASLTVSLAVVLLVGPGDECLVERVEGLDL